MIQLLEKRPILTIILVVGFMLLPNLDALEVTIMEARNFVTAREMLTDGNWLLTTMNGEPRYEKPPLPTWLTAFSAALFGIKSVWAMRFPAVLMVMVLGIMIFTLSRKLKLSKRHALLNALVSITSLYTVLIIFEAPWDIYAHAFMLTGIYFIFKIVQGQRDKSISSILLATCCIAASILSKGPVSLYALFLPFLIAYILVYRKDTLRRSWIVVSIIVVLGLCLGFSWYAYVRFIDPETFSRIATKETGNWTSYNVRPFYYYWSFFVQSGLWTIPAVISLLYPYLVSRVSNRKAYRFTVLWTLLAVVLLSIIPEKKSRYLMPVLIPLALNIGFYLEYLVRQFSNLKNRREVLPVYFNFGLVSVIFLTIPIMAFYLIISGNIASPILAIIAFCVLFILSMYLLRALYRKKLLSVIYGVVLALTLAVIAGMSVLDNTRINERYSSIQDRIRIDKLPLYSLQINAPEVYWDSGKKITVLTSPEERITHNEFYLLVCSTCTDTVTNNFPAYKVVFISDYDLNFNAINTRGYKERKAGKIFKLSRL